MKQIGIAHRRCVDQAQQALGTLRNMAQPTILCADVDRGPLRQRARPEDVVELRAVVGLEKNVMSIQGKAAGGNAGR
ncbi:MAG: hypothetical protein EBR18_03870, partial [Betaproteobacteria bacterium]|nr:hypothetical protein [Betaproteobacteria bacterium]